MEPTQLLAGLFDKKKMTIIKHLLDHQDQEFGVRELAKATRVAPATTHRILQTLLKMGLVEDKKIKQLKLYKLQKNKATTFLDELLAVKKSAIEEFVENVKGVPGIQEILQHGKATKEKVSLLVVGQNIDTAALSKVVGEIKERYKFTILHMALSPDQYAQMLSMGLYAGEKQTLYRR
jgi:DNA-binding transcriptional regulator YhcF (GntR family)